MDAEASEKIIAHLDLDAFFASVEEVYRPWLKDKPIAVGSDPQDGHGRGVVSTANYKAREYGIHSALPISHAWRLSEQAKKQGKEPVTFLQPNFALYKKVSENVAKVIMRHSADIEQASVDEFYFDLTAAGTFTAAEKICADIKKEIKKTEKVTCSIGIAPNKYIAKIAAGFKKPDGLYVVTPENVLKFLAPLNIRDIPGIGPKTAEIFYKKNIKTIMELRQFSETELKTLVGKHGIGIYQMARGIGSTEIIYERQAKSIGEQTTFDYDSLEAGHILNVYQKLCGSVFASFTRTDFTAFKTITVTVRFSDFQTQNKSHTLKTPIAKTNKKQFEIEALKLLLPFLDKRQNPKRKPIRLIGVRIEKLI